MALYTLVGTKNPDTDWTTQVVLERDDDGNVTASVGVGQPAELTKEQVDQLEGQGLVLDQVSKTEADEMTARQSARAAGDTAGAAPMFGESTDPNQEQD